MISRKSMGRPGAPVLSLVLSLAAALLGVHPRAAAIEPWADASLSVADGLELWIDPSRIAAGRRARGLPAETASGVDVAPDASGRGRDLAQPATEMRPRLEMLAGAPAFLRFDGVDDHLTGVFPGLATADATIFLVASAHANPGVFRAFLSANERGRNDYTTGLNVDLGPAASARIATLNVEGRGFSGAASLLSRPIEFGAFTVLAIRSAAGGKTTVRAGGAAGGERERGAGAIALEEIRLGARHYINEPGAPYARGFLRADVAELLVYGRALSAAEVRAVEAYLERKHAAALARAGEAASAGAVARALVPGVAIDELPIAITNVNALLHDRSGRLLALLYDGRVLALVDTDGDGLPDDTAPYWEPSSLRQPIAMALGPRGLYVTSNGKVSLLIDADGDGRAEREEIVSEGWQLPDVSTGGGVDALGVAIAPSGDVYFGLGCADFTNAYRIADGKPRYDIASERGTILRVGADGKRSIVCTGIRFPVALAFNRHGDLFATDQEGETWLPGGNPIDELDHIIAGRHYGFPPRHAQHLPSVDDEPPVVGFGPQHQSTCGLVFDEPRPASAFAPARGRFGPESWHGDAIVAGYSRGKLWRAPIARSGGEGYAGGRPQLLASFEMLAVAVDIAPSGDLFVACHGGAPDWGNGPAGEGRLFRLRFADAAAPQAVAAWAASPIQARIAFDRPVGERVAATLAGKTIAYGEHVRAGDRFELHRPGYASVEAQQRAPRGALGVAAAHLEDGGRTLVLSTDPQSARATYAIEIDGLSDAGKRVSTLAAVDWDLAGLEAQWSAADGRAPSEIELWVPHPDPQVAAALTRGSAAHERWLECLRRPGRLTLRARIDAPAALWRLRAGGDLALDVDGNALRPAPAADGAREIAVEIARGASIEASLPTGRGSATRLEVAIRERPDGAWRPASPGMFLLPWAPLEPPAAPPPAPPPVEISGGDPERGREIFFGDAARCGSCHRFRDAGASLGPDLSNLVHRDAASVRRDIVDPAASIHPDHASSTVILDDGRVLTGLVRSEGAGALRLLDADAREHVIDRDRIARIVPSAVSIMPAGIDKAIGEEGVRDLLAFLTTVEEPRVDPNTRPGAPAPRSRAAIEALLRLDAAAAADSGASAVSSASAAPAARAPLRIVLVAGPKDHGPGEHDYPDWQRRTRRLLSRVPGVLVSTASGWPERGHWDLADVLVFYFWNHEWSAARAADLDAFLARGGGAVFIHSAVIADRDGDALAARLGLAWRHGQTKFRHGPLELAFRSDGPAGAIVARGLDTAAFIDESYWPLAGDADGVEVIATAVEEGEPRPILWARESGKGRVFCSLLGHYAWTFEDPLFRLILARAIAWTARAPAETLAGWTLDDVAVRD